MGYLQRSQTPSFQLDLLNRLLKFSMQEISECHQYYNLSMYEIKPFKCMYFLMFSNFPLVPNVVKIVPIFTMRYYV